MNQQTITQRIQQFRHQMLLDGIDAAIIPQTDPHQSEYLADHFQIRRWLSGFTGSAGDLLITHSQAFIWADSRYWLQAAEQLHGTPVQVMEDGKPDVPTITQWLCTNLTPGQTVGLDGMMFSISQTQSLRQALDKHNINLNVNFNPIPLLWTDRPALPDCPVFIHTEEFAGQSAQTKIADILHNAQTQGADAAFISDLAEIAWTLNLRSRDVHCNPVLTSFLYLSPSQNILFVNQNKITPQVQTYLLNNHIQTLPYTEALPFLASLPQQTRVLASQTQTSGLAQATLGSRIVPGSSPVALLKGVKNQIQIQGVRRAMERDGVAMVRSLIEIENTVNQGLPLTELNVAEILTKHRSKGAHYFDESFDTIAGFGPHGAIVHYSATPQSSSNITTGNLLLIDSGANYFDGTTDITRTISLGTPSAAQRHDFTLVMKGHIALAQAVFPAGTRGSQLDALARIYLWKNGLSYLHGTGHGVGHFLNVHEGPQNIRLNENPTPLLPGMITSNEPGIYRPGEYGIRCENLILTIPAMTTEFGDFYQFETLTLCPFDLSLFDTEIMTTDELDWVNQYHATVRERLLPLLQPAEQEWLIQKTSTLQK